MVQYCLSTLGGCITSVEDVFKVRVFSKGVGLESRMEKMSSFDLMIGWEWAFYVVCILEF